MLNLILCGPPGSGKGTQAKKLVEKYKLVHISTGDLFRREKKANSETWQEVQSYIDKGELAPDSITFDLLEKEMAKTPNAVGYIFDGFPRNVNQATLLDDFLAKKDTEVTMLIELDVADEEIIKRIVNRGKTSGRTDDQDPAIIQNRINVYNKETAPVAKHYAKVNKTQKVDGIGTIEEIFGRICAEIDAVMV